MGILFIVIVFIVGAILIAGYIADQEPVKNMSDEKLRRLLPKLQRIRDPKAVEIYIELESREKTKINESEVSRKLTNEARNRFFEICKFFVDVNDPHQIAALANKVIKDTTLEFRKRGLDLQYSEMGNKYLEDKNYIESRANAGLTTEDILKFWNRPLLVVHTDIRAADELFLACITIADAGLKGDKNASQQLSLYSETMKRNTPRFGDPASFNASDKFYKNLTLNDAPLYIEFIDRIIQWKNTSSRADIEKIIKENGTFNSAIRKLVASGEL